MRIFKTKSFSRWARKEGLTDKALIEAAHEVKEGLVDGRLGGGVCKKRVGLNGRGKRGGVRTLLAYFTGSHAFFVFGFSKSERSNITKEETDTLKKLAKNLLSYDEKNIKQALKAGELKEIKDGYYKING